MLLLAVVIILPKNNASNVFFFRFRHVFDFLKMYTPHNVELTMNVLRFKSLVIDVNYKTVDTPNDS